MSATSSLYPRQVICYRTHQLFPQFFPSSRQSTTNSPSSQLPPSSQAFQQELDQLLLLVVKPYTLSRPLTSPWDTSASPFNKVSKRCSLTSLLFAGNLTNTTWSS